MSSIGVSGRKRLGQKQRVAMKLEDLVLFSKKIKRESVKMKPKDQEH
jgi:hypothetical protein